MPYEYKSYYFDDPIVNGRVMDIMLPKSITRPFALFFVHGGGWAMGSRTGYHAIMRAFNREGFICAATDYRLCAPGVTIFDQLTDIRHGYGLFAELLKKSGRPVRIVVHGSSAGAHLASLLVLAAPGQCGEPAGFKEMNESVAKVPKKNGHDEAWPSTTLKKRLFSSVEGRALSRPQTFAISSNITEWILPAAAVLQSTPVLFEPWEDMFPHIWTSMQHAMGASYEERPDLYRKAAPYNYISETSCPIFFMEAECEHMFPLKYIVQFAEKMRSLGRRAEYKIYKNAEHGFFYDVTRRQQKEALADILKFIGSLPEKD